MKYGIIILLIAGLLYSHREDIQEKFKPRKPDTFFQEEEIPFVAPIVAPKKPETSKAAKISPETQFQIDILERNENVAARRLNELLRNPPVFQERKSSKGIRTSDADRKKAIEARNREISNLRIYLDTIKTERNKLLNK